MLSLQNCPFHRSLGARAYGWLPPASGRYQRLWPYGWPPRYAGTRGTGSALSPAGMRAYQSWHPKPFQGSWAVYMGQACICLPCHPHPHRHLDYGRTAWARRAVGADLVLPRLFRFAGTDRKRQCLPGAAPPPIYQSSAAAPGDSHRSFPLF